MDTPDSRHEMKTENLETVRDIAAGFSSLSHGTSYNPPKLRYEY